jgi:hypothetical protein
MNECIGIFAIDCGHAPVRAWNRRPFLGIMTLQNSKSASSV